MLALCPIALPQHAELTAIANQLTENIVPANLDEVLCRTLDRPFANYSENEFMARLLVKRVFSSAGAKPVFTQTNSGFICEIENEAIGLFSIAEAETRALAATKAVVFFIIFGIQ